MSVDTAFPPRIYNARVIGIDDALADTRILHVEADNRQRVGFAAGQYAMLTLPKAEPRAFSIASAPGKPALEFHIRSIGGGSTSRALHELQPGSELKLEAPFGTGHWRQSGRPLLLIGGGMGIAPLKSILEAHLAQGGPVPAHLYWGVRSLDHLYLDRFFRDLAGRNPRFGYIPLLPEGAIGGGIRTGFLGSAVAEDFEHLGDTDIYLAGPPAMVEATLPVLLQRGAEKSMIYSDGVSW